MSQFLAREVMNWQTLEIYKASGLRPAMQVHDELVYVVDKSIGDDMLDLVLSKMKGAIPWWPGVVTSAEGDVAEIYGDAK